MDKALFEAMIKQGIDQGGKSFNEGQQIQGAQENEKLKALLQGQQKKQQLTDSTNLAKKMFGIAPDDPEGDVKLAGALKKSGASLSFGPEHFSMGQDPTAKAVAGNIKGGAAAIQHANDSYMKSLPKMQAAHAKINEALKIINDPNQTASVGAAKSLLISGVAEMNRYNQEEGKALVPDNTLQKLTQFANSMGGDKNPLTDVQRRSINSMLGEGLNGLKQNHDILKQNAIQGYTMSPYAEPNRVETMKTNLGSPFSTAIDQSMKGMNQYPTTQASELGQHAAPPSQAGGLKGWLSGIWGGNSPQAAPAQPGGPETKKVGGSTFVKQNGQWVEQ